MDTRSKLTPFLIGLVLISSLSPSAYAMHSVPGAGAQETRTKAVDNGSDAGKLAALRTKADQEIARRLASLNQLQTRIASMNKLSDAQKASLKTYLASQIEELNTLKTKIDAETDLAKLKEETKSITQSYRIFALVLPQGAVMAAGDRALALAKEMVDVGTKLNARIATAKAAGKDVAALEKTLTDYYAKIANAKTQAQAAVDAVSKLTPDGGDKAKMAANLKALKDARTKIQLAQQDFVAARKDANDILQALRKLDKTTAAANQD
jgi:hypothetical protein